MMEINGMRVNATLADFTSIEECSANSASAYMCNLPAGHARGVHVAGDGDRVVAIWPTEDPSERMVWQVTAAHLNSMADRELTDVELERIAKAIDHSSIPEALETILDQFRTEEF